MGQVHFVVVMRELDREGQRVVGPTALLLELVLVLDDVVACSVPPDTRQLGLLLRVDQRFHALVVGALRLDQVHKIELVGRILLRVRDSEKVPLRVDT